MKQPSAETKILKAYIVRPPEGWGGNDMVIVAESADEAENMFYKKSTMTSDYYKEARENGCEVSLIDTKTKDVYYERQDNL
jgi:hypothetical protein